MCTVKERDGQKCETEVNTFIIHSLLFLKRSVEKRLRIKHVGYSSGVTRHRRVVIAIVSLLHFV